MAESIGQRVKRYRRALGLNQREAADLAGLSQATWARIESGTTPTVGQLAGVAVALGRTLESFTDDTPLRDRLQSASRFRRAPGTDAEQAELEAVKDKLAFMMEVEVHLSVVGVGVHA